MQPQGLPRPPRHPNRRLAENNTTVPDPVRLPFHPVSAATTPTTRNAAEMPTWVEVQLERRVLRLCHLPATQGSSVSFQVTPGDYKSTFSSNL